MHRSEVAPTGSVGDIALFQLDDGLGIPEEGIIPASAKFPGVFAFARHDVSSSPGAATIEASPTRSQSRELQHRWPTARHLSHSRLIGHPNDRRADENI
jgi:hypothetical protein